MLLLLMLIQILFTNVGSGHYQLFGLNIPKHGLYQGSLLSLRLLIILFSAKILAPMSYQEFDQAFRKLPLRQKIDVYALTALSVLGGFIFKSGAQAIALELRGFRSKGKTSRLLTRNLGFADLITLLITITISIFLIIF